MFDTTQPIPLNVVTPAGDKQVTVNFPTDQQLIDRVARMKTILRSLSRGKSKHEPVPSEKHDAELFAKIKTEGADLDEYEASQVISRLTRSTVTDSKREGNQFIVNLKVPGANTVHTLKVPSAKQQKAYSDGVYSMIQGRHGISEIKLNLSASETLYDALVIKTEGYVGDVAPVTHKGEVVSEVITLMNQDMGDEGDSELDSF